MMEMTPTPRRWANTGDTSSGNDAIHRAAMEQGSITLRDRIHTLLADRQAKFGEVLDRNDAARVDIRKDMPRDVVMRRHDLSVTAYEQLAGQVRAGA